MASKIRIIIRSFERPFLKNTDFEGFSRIRLPETRVVYTVNRSPHVDKKSREQFEMRVKTYVLDAKPEVQDLRKKFFWLKRQRIFGAQYEVRLSTKTRLDMSKFQAKA